MGLKQNIPNSKPNLSLSEILNYRVFNLLKVEYLLYILIFVFAFVTRFWDLGSKTLHHDESLHAVYSNYLYEGGRKFLDNVVSMLSMQKSPLEVLQSYFGSQRGEGLNYYFDPMMHGPLLFHMQAAVFFICGLINYMWQLPLFLLVAFLGIVGTSKYFVLRRTYSSKFKKYFYFSSILLLNLTLLFLLVYKFTGYASDKLAGVSDYSSRIASAILAVILVMLPLLFREYLGRLGALIVSIIMLISPTALYVGRFQRHDIYLMVPAVIIVFAFLAFIKTKQKKYFYLFGLSVGLIYTTHEAYYIISFAFFLFLVGVLLFEYFENRRNFKLKKTIEQPVAGGLKSLLDRPLVLVTGISLFLAPIILLYSTLFSNPGGFLQSLPNPFDTRTALGYWLSQQEVARGSQNWRYYLTLMLPYEILTVIFGIISIGFTGFRMGRERIKQAFIFLGTLTITFLVLQVEDLIRISRYQKLKESGLLAQEYLLTLREESVLGTLIFFLFFLLVFFVPYFIARSQYKNKKTGLTPAGAFSFPYFIELFFINWLALVFIILSWAGEKMPWINLQIAVPMIFLACFSLRDIITRLFKFIIQTPFQVLLILASSFYLMYLVMHPEKAFSFVFWVPAWLIIFICGVNIFIQIQTSLKIKITLIFTVFSLGVLSTYSLVSAFRVSYIYPDDPAELLVYTQSSKDVIDVSEKIKKVANSLANPKDIRITIESTQTWPFVWYLRDFDKIGYPASITSTSNEEIILIAKDSDAKMKPILKDYVGEQYTLRWWWLVDLVNWKDPKFQTTNYFKFWTSPELWKWFFTRQVWSIKGTYDGMFYVRKDKAQEVWVDAVPVGESAKEEIKPDPYLEKQLKPQFVSAFGENGTTAGNFNEPKDIAFDSKGNIFVVDRKNNRIQKFNSAGKFLAAFGESGTEAGKFNDPSGISIDSQDIIYIADTWNHRIQKFNTDGQFLTSFGKPGQGDIEAEFWGPRDIIVSGKDIYVTDTGNKKVKKFDLSGKLIKVIGGPGFEEGLFNEPIGIEADANFIYVADTWNHRIQKFDTEGKFITKWDIAGWQGQHNNNEPYLAKDSRGNILATDPPNHRILQFSANGKFLGMFGKSGSNNLEFDKPTGIAVDQAGYVYIADTINSRVQKLKL